MKVLILTLGTRGDIQPFVALAKGLVAAGHQAVLAAPERFTGFAAEHGVQFAGVDNGPMRLVDDPAEAGKVIEGGVRVRLRQAREMPEMFEQVLEDCWQVASDGAGAGADVIVHNGQILAGQHVAEALGVPAVLGLPLPMAVPTREFPWPGQALPRWFPATLNRSTYLGMKAPAAMFGGVVDRWRDRTLGLPKRPGRHDPLCRPDGGQAPVLHAFSPAVLPRPADWPEPVLTTGYWFLPATGRPLPDQVEDFLASGPPPVFVGFGSMSGRDPAHTTGLVVEAVRRTGARLIMATGWGGLSGALGSDRDDVLVVNEIDYQALLPRVSVVVHHGGAGTTGVACASGRPQLVCPFGVDQPFWGRLMQLRGVGPAPLPHRRLTAARLHGTLTGVLGDPSIAAVADRLGQRVRAEDGVAVAVAAIEQAA